MEVNSFQILLVDVTSHLLHIQHVVLNVLIKMKTRIYAAPAVKGLNLKSHKDLSSKFIDHLKKI